MVKTLGPETGFAPLGAGECDVWAIGGTSGIQASESVRDFNLVDFSNADDPGLGVTQAAARRWRDAGLAAAIFIPPRSGADINDMVWEGAA